MAAAMAAEAAERHLGLLRDEREAELAQSRCGTPTGHAPAPPGGYGWLGGARGRCGPWGTQSDPGLAPAGPS